MDAYSFVILAIFIVLIILTGKLFGAHFPSVQYSPVSMIARIGIFGAMASILYLVPIFKIHLPFFPSFLELHFDEIPAFIAGFAYGPLTGVAVIAIKTAMKFLFYGVTPTLGVGEATDFILSSIYVFIACFIYSKKRNLKGVAIGFSVATLAQVVVAMFINVYVMIPFYCNVMNYPVDRLLKLMQTAMPAITDVEWSYAFIAVLPFNLLKDAIVIAVTFVLYRSLHVFLRFEGKKKRSRHARP